MARASPRPLAWRSAAPPSDGISPRPTDGRIQPSVAEAQIRALVRRNLDGNSSLEIKMFNPLAPKLLAELIGTFAFVFIGAGAAAIVGQSVGLPGIATIAFAHGLTIMVFVFAYGAVSGGHFNPAVTIGVLAAGAMRAGEAIGYIISQLVGGVIGALLLAAVLGGTATGLGTPALAHDLALGHTTVTITPAIGFVIEAVLAFFLVTVVLETAVAGRAGNLAPLAIGMTLTLNIMMGGPLTGAPFNPARALGPMIATGDLSNAWLYVTAPIVGALAAAIVHMGIAGLAAQPATAQARVPASSPAE
jgi:MIP family channel proteins